MTSTDHVRPDGARTSAVIAGLRRVDSVRILVSADTTVAVVTGVAWRYPREYRIPLATALALADCGIPLRIEHLEPTSLLT